jgi:iron only hydrogenase large subunit-like protein
MRSILSVSKEDIWIKNVGPRTRKKEESSLKNEVSAVTVDKKKPDLDE